MMPSDLKAPEIGREWAAEEFEPILRAVQGLGLIAAQTRFETKSYPDPKTGGITYVPGEWSLTLEFTDGTTTTWTHDRYRYVAVGRSANQ